MPKEISRQVQIKKEKEKDKAYKRYQKGYSLREIGKKFGKSHEWARNAINERKALILLELFESSKKDSK